MSLRNEIHETFDLISPPTGGMAERVVDTAVQRARVHERRRKFMLRVRAPMSLVAALLLIAIVVAVFIGTRLVQDWNVTHGVSPAGHGLPSLQELEERPWQHQLLAAGESCPTKQFISGNLSQSPVAATGTSVETAGFGEYSKGFTVIQPGFTGLMIIRLRDARTGKNDVFIEDNAGGAVVGTDTVDGVSVEQHAEAVFDTADPKVKPAPNGTRLFWIREGHRLPPADCFEWQFDGTYKGSPFVWHWYFSG